MSLTDKIKAKMTENKAANYESGFADGRESGVREVLAALIECGVALPFTADDLFADEPTAKSDKPKAPGAQKKAAQRAAKKEAAQEVPAHMMVRDVTGLKFLKSVHTDEEGNDTIKTDVWSISYRYDGGSMSYHSNGQCAVECVEADDGKKTYYPCLLNGDHFERVTETKRKITSEVFFARRGDARQSASLRATAAAKKAA